MKLTKRVKTDIIKIVFALILIAFAGSIWTGLSQGEEVVVVEAKIIPTPTVTPTSTPDPTIKEVIDKTFGKDADVAYAVAQAESGLVSDKCHIDEIEYSCGLFQINLRAHFNKVPGNTFEEKAEFLKEPHNNILMAKFLHGSSGWQPWSVWKNRTYLQFIN